MGGGGWRWWGASGARAARGRGHRRGASVVRGERGVARDEREDEGEEEEKKKRRRREEEEKRRREAEMKKRRREDEEKRKRGEGRPAERKGRR